MNTGERVSDGSNTSPAMAEASRSTCITQLRQQPACNAFVLGQLVGTHLCPPPRDTASLGWAAPPGALGLPLHRAGVLDVARRLVAPARFGEAQSVQTGKSCAAHRPRSTVGVPPPAIPGHRDRGGSPASVGVT